MNMKVTELLRKHSEQVILLTYIFCIEINTEAIYYIEM